MDVVELNFLDLVGFYWVERPKVDSRGLWYFDIFYMFFYLNGCNDL